MKKKLLIFALVVVSAFACAFGISGCTQKPNNSYQDGHTAHTFNRQIAESKYLKSAATCTTKAVYYFSCSCGEHGTETFEYGEFNGHSFVTYTYNNDATCTTDGTKTAKCEHCAQTDTIKDETHLKTGHSFTQEKAEAKYLKTSAECTHKAVYYKSCSTCGLASTTDTFEYGEPNGHSFVTYTYNNDATCTTDGTKTAKCEHCAQTDTIKDETHLKTGHSFTQEKTEARYLKSEADCTNKAVYYKSCSVCGLPSTSDTFEYGEPNGHSFTQEKTESIYLKEEANCTHKAVYYKSCSVCGEKGAETFEIGQPKGHTEVAIGTAKAPTCTEKGLTAGKKCSVCNVVIEEQTEISAAGHSFNAEVVESKYLKAEADCSHKAVYFKSCSVCGEKGTETYEYGQPRGHAFQNGKCTVCGVSEPTFGLEYKLNEDGISYSVYEGSSTASRIVIADIYNGLPVTSIGRSAFEGCTGLTSIIIPNSVTSIDIEAFKGCTGLTSITIPKNVTSIGQWAFFNCSGLTDIYLSDGLKVIGREAFLLCGDFTINYTGGIKGWCGIRCRSSQKLYIDGKDLRGELVIPNGVTSIGDSAFRYCSRLRSITIPSSVTSIGPGAFADCSGLTSIVIPNGVASIGQITFYNCTSLTSITIPDSVTSIGSDAFWGCTGLTSITIPDSVTYINGFMNCTNLTSINIPESVTSIGSGAFWGCTGLTSINIPDNVTSIGDNAFTDCSGLTSITIPKNVTNIGRGAFSGCSKLTRVTFKNTSGWEVFISLLDDRISISNALLANSSTAATYLKSTYDGYYWRRG